MRRTPWNPSPQAFTLVETLVAITILTIAIIGPFHAVQTALNIARASRDALAASSLAQEGIEYVRSVRDNNFAYTTANPSAPGTWLYGFDGTNRGSGSPSKNCYSSSCTVDPAIASVLTAVAVCSGTCPVLNLSSAGLYTQQSGSGFTATRFRRTVTFTSINAHETKVTSTVSWITGGVPYSVVAIDYLQNWL